MYVPAQAVGNAAVQAGGPSDGGTAEMARLRETAQAIQASEENGAVPGPVQAETTAAVQATPVSAKAVKVDLDADRAAKDGVIEYPITGPDKFARTIAEAKKVVYEEEQRAKKSEALDQVAKVRDARAAAIEDNLEYIAQTKATEASMEASGARVDRGTATSAAHDAAVAENKRATQAAVAVVASERAAKAATDTAAQARPDANV